MGEGSVGTGLSGRGHNDRNVEELADGGVGDHVVPVEGVVKVACELVKADLEVEDQEKGVVLVQAFPGHGYVEDMLALVFVLLVGPRASSAYLLRLGECC